MLDLGGVYRIEVPIKTDGDLVNPATAELVVTLPDGSTVEPAVALPPAVTGMIVVDYPTTMQGRHGYVLSTTGPQTAYRDVFDVRVADESLIVSLDDVRSHLNITNRSDDPELRGFAEAASNIVEAYVGSVANRTHSESRRVLASDRQIGLRYWPVTEITSAERNGSTVDPSDLEVSDLGMLRYTSGAPMTGTWNLTYTVGRTVVGANVTRAVLIITQHLWDTQRPRNSRDRPQRSTVEEMSVADGKGGFYSIPRKAVELLEFDVTRAVA